MKTPPVRIRGFTLTELAIVLIIVALLLGGMLIPLSTQTDIRNRSAEEAALEEFRQALVGFVIQNGRLPCPASRTQTGAGAGLEMTTGTGVSRECSCTTAGSGVAGTTAACTATSVAGTLPWATLGFSESDTWGNRYTYHMTTMFGRGINPTRNPATDFGAGCTPDSAPQKSAVAICTPGNITVQAAPGTVISSNLPAVIVSHGKNSAGAWNPQGTQIAGAAGDELENSDSDNTFVSRSDLDDVVVWLPTPILVNRMITAGKLP